MAIQSIKIHPGIGIARLGNSPTDFFIGPETPGVSVLPTGGYRDSKGRIKRQAARFRLFGYDGDGKLVRELTSADADIEWTVHLANAKAAWQQFHGLNSSTPLRNSDVRDRQALVIDPGPRTIRGSNQSAKFDSGLFLGSPVPLGDIRSDADARLLVLGGFGKSGSPKHAPITTFANNDGWHDDVSDGPVNATVRLRDGGQVFQAVPAWVIVGPPKYAPDIHNVITLYDVLLQVAVDKLGLKLRLEPSFTQDIYPLLQRAIAMRWVSAMVSQAGAHQANAKDKGASDGADGATPSTPPHQTLPAVTPPPGAADARAAIFDKLRDPALSPHQSSGESDMPMIHSDYYPLDVNQPLTALQFEMMRKWKDGNFRDDWNGPPVPVEFITPAGLDRAGLETCVGGAFYPGIEASWMLRDSFAYSEPFRLDASLLNAGDVTRQMSVPWQADFTDCAQEGELAWWPAQRPDDVFPKGATEQVPWTRDLAESPEDMIRNWHKLGFVVKDGDKFVETDRNP